MTLIGELGANPAPDAGFRVGVAPGDSRPSLRSSALAVLATLRKSGRAAAAGSCLPDVILLGRAGSSAVENHRLSCGQRSSRTHVAFAQGQKPDASAIAKSAPG